MGLKLANNGFLRQSLGHARNKKPGPGAHNVDAKLDKAKGGYIGQKVKIGGIIRISKYDASPASYQIDVTKKLRTRPKSATTFGNAERINSLCFSDDPGPG